MAAVATVAASCGTATATGPGGHRTRLDAHAGTTAPGTAPGTALEQRLATGATAAYQVAIAGNARSFVGAVTTLESALRAGDVLAARQDELEAQADFDRFRWLETAYTGNAAALDELASAVPTGQAFGGLHAVEQALWPAAASGATPDPPSTTAAIAASSGLVAQAPVAEYLLGKERLSPEVIGTTAVQELGWVAAVALPGREEEFSHHDDVDVAATVDAADAAFHAIGPLANAVDPALAGRVQARFTALLDLVDSLGSPDRVSTIPSDARVAITGALDATAAQLSTLAARMTPFGTTGPLP
jgi:iron uptake system EfeUOB component EfeO/EfeM